MSGAYSDSLEQCIFVKSNEMPNCRLIVPCRPSVKIQRTFRLFHGPDRDAMGVDHGCFQTGVSQKFLNDADVVVDLEKVGGKGVAEAM